MPKIFAYESHKRSSKEKDGHVVSKHGRRYKKSPHRKGKDLASTESAIEEEYSQDFEDSVPKSDKITDSKSDSIKEESMAKGRSSSSSDVKKPKGLKGSGKLSGQISSGRRKNVREESDSIAEDVIEEESNIQDDTIEEETIAEISGDASSSRKKASASIEEESIIKEEYSQDNFDVYDASQSLAARNRVRFGIHSGSAKAPPPPKTAEEVKK